VTRRGGVTTSAREEAAPRRRKGGENTNWTDTNFTGQKMKKITQPIQLIQIDGEDLKR
jgi:hypothetical protein